MSLLHQTCANPDCNTPVDGGVGETTMDRRFYCSPGCAGAIPEMEYDQPEVCADNGELYNRSHCEKCGHELKGASHMLCEEVMLEVCDTCFLYGYESKLKKSRAEQQAEKNWEYVFQVLDHAGYTWQELDEIGFHYKTAFVKGYRRSVKDSTNKTTEE